MEGARRLALLAVLGALLPGCGSSHPAAYSGRLYSVGQVKKAFASLGFQLRSGRAPAPGIALLVVSRNRGTAADVYSTPHTVSVLVATRRDAETGSLAKPGHSLAIRYANVTVYSKPIVLDEVRGSMAALRWGTYPSARPGQRLIVPGDSIGGIRLGQSRRSVEKLLGTGKPGELGSVQYLGGRLVVGYEFHDRVYNFVTYVEARGSGYRMARSGIHVGSARADLGRLYVSCYGRVRADCMLEAGPWPDPIGTWFIVRHGKVSAIGVGRLA